MLLIQDLVTKIKQTCADIHDIKGRSRNKGTSKHIYLSPFRGKGSPQRTNKLYNNPPHKSEKIKKENKIKVFEKQHNDKIKQIC